MSGLHIADIGLEVIFLGVMLFLLIVGYKVVLNKKNKLNRKLACILKCLVVSIILIECINIHILTIAGVSRFKYLYLIPIVLCCMQSLKYEGIILSVICSGILFIVEIIFNSNWALGIADNLIFCAQFIIVACIVTYYARGDQNKIKSLQDIANKDALTNVYNYRSFSNMLNTAMDISKEKSGQVSLIFVDIDHFKYYNDLYGHERGNKALIKLASILKKNIRTKDIVCRYGGEEFVIILPCTSKKRALSIAENLRCLVENTYFEGEENQINGKMTISVGISNYPEDANDEYELIKTCEYALYRAKYLNRNRVEAYTSVLDELKNEIEEDQLDNVASIKTLIAVINAKDKYTFGHVERVVMYSKIFANTLGLSKKDTKALVYAAYVHDIGKINISVDILNKKEPLTNEEWEQLKLHPTQGVDIVKNVPALSYILPYILHHHERYDGRGYPYGLKGNDIPYLARVLTVVDSFDAMTSKRPYGESKTYDKAIDELQRCSGTQFDPYLASEFIEVIKKHKSRFDDLDGVINEMNN